MINIMISSEDIFDSIFLYYEKILTRLNLMKATTKAGKKITYTDLKKAINVMVKKHPLCRWKSEKIKSRKYYVLVEGYAWLVNVYFQKKKTLLDADVEFFKNRIKEYEELLKIQDDKNWWNENMNIKQLCRYFNKKDITIRKAIKKMCDNGMERYKLYIDGKVIISKDGVEWLAKNVFKNKYLELLEKYKMKLTEKYIQGGYPYDEFFGRN